MENNLHDRIFGIIQNINTRNQHAWDRPCQFLEKLHFIGYFSFFKNAKPAQS